jgi:hypothetical protein
MFSCQDTCQTCSGINSTDCTSCLEDDFIIKVDDQTIDKGQCISESSCNLSGGYSLLSPMGTQKCYKCGQNCESCQEKFNNDKCSSCVVNYNLLKQQSQSYGSCVASCPNTHYAKNNICELCTGGCETCTGSDYGKCLTCATNRYLVTKSQLKYCFLKCKPGFYYDLANTQECLPCKAPCKDCQDSANNCTSCINSNFVVKFIGSTQKLQKYPTQNLPIIPSDRNVENSVY